MERGDREGTCPRCQAGLAPAEASSHSPAPTWFSFQQVLSLNGGDLGHGGEDVGAVCGRPFHAVAVVDLPLTRLPIHIELGVRKAVESEEQGKVWTFWSPGERG